MPLRSGSSRRRILSGGSAYGTIATQPATSAAALRAVRPGALDGNYWYKPAGYTGSAIQCYTNFTNAPSGKGYVLVARGRESTDWWNINGQNTSSLLQANLITNTPIAVSPDSFVNSLVGGNWNLMRMLVNRYINADSFYIQGTTSSTFSWGPFNASPSGLATTLTRYTSSWKGGSVSYTGTNFTGWTDTNAAGLAGNDCSRLFTWTWSSHGGFQGWSAGNGCGTAGLYQAGGETHGLDLAQVYIEC